jgi:hypothetical protein
VIGWAALAGATDVVRPIDRSGLASSTVPQA